MLGIGISGVYMGFTKHKPSELAISYILYISCAILLSTLIAYHVFSLYNNYIIDRKLGYALILVYLIGMIINVYLEFS